MQKIVNSVNYIYVNADVIGQKVVPLHPHLHK